MSCVPWAAKKQCLGKNYSFTELSAFPSALTALQAVVGKMQWACTRGYQLLHTIHITYIIHECQVIYFRSIFNA